MLRKSSGITLIALVVTIVILLILAGTATFTGMKAVENSIISTFRTEMEMMKLQLNSPSELEKYKNAGSVLEESQKNYLTKVQNSLNQDNISITLKIDGFKYFTKEEIKTISNIEITRNLYINPDTKTIVSSEGVNCDGKICYMLEQLPNSLYNVETNIQNLGDVTFDVIADKLSITVSNIQYNAPYVNKGTIQYKLSTDENWTTVAKDSTSKNFTFEVPYDDEKYDIRIIDAKENEYTKNIIVSKNWDNKVNMPKILTGMIPIKFKEATETKKGETIDTTVIDIDWYNYDSKKWANAKTQDGSMWVWIPRYAYRINSSTQTTDVVFLIGTTDYYYDENGQIQEAKRAKTEAEEIDTTEGYTVHPAFTDESSINFRNGGWDKELTGIWVSKFEAGYASGGNTATVKASNVPYTQKTAWVWKTEAGTTNNSTQPARNWLDGVYGSTTTAIKYPTFQGSTYSMNYINHSDSYSIAKALTDSGNIYGLSSTNADSHLMKNSEWGACSYLSKSKYGLEGTDIAVNSKNLNSGGQARTSNNGKTGVESVYAVTGYNNNGNEWNDYLGENLSASTTGNIYGIYDMSGGMWERTAGIVSNGHSYLYTYGKSIIDEANITYTVSGDSITVNRNTGTSTKYVSIYPNNDSDQTNLDTACQKNYEVNTKIYGDGVKETSTAGTGTTSWYADYSHFPALGYPFFGRGGYWGVDSGAGLFYFHRNDGSSDYAYGFRAVLVAQ